MIGRIYPVLVSLKEARAELEGILSSFSSIYSRLSEAILSAITGIDIMVKSLSDISSFIDTKTNSFKGLVNELSELKEGISQMKSSLKVIFELSEDITLLSFNASVIAAKGKELGVGFSVIASAIGELAERTENSSKAIEEKMENIISSLNHIYKHVSEDSSMLSEISIDSITSNLASVKDSIVRLSSYIDDFYHISHINITDRLKTISSIIPSLERMLDTTLPDITRVDVSKFEQVLDDLGNKVANVMNSILDIKRNIKENGKA
jgi:methyl-accepting chemotaxis protein